MEVVFADAFYFIALLNRADAHHQQAVTASAAQDAALVTTEYALLEVADALAETKQRRDIHLFIGHLRADPTMEVVEGNRELFELGLRLYSQRPDKRWSLTDCISFIVMNQRGITTALTHDHHFKQAGFHILL